MEYWVDRVQKNYQQTLENDGIDNLKKCGEKVVVFMIGGSVPEICLRLCPPCLNWVFSSDSLCVVSPFYFFLTVC